MGIPFNDDDDPEIQLAPSTLRGELLVALRKAALETYYNFVEPSRRRILEAHTFANAIEAAITAEVYEDAIDMVRQLLSVD